jgi:CHASE1-domain containing sensor protein
MKSRRLITGLVLTLTILFSLAAPALAQEGTTERNRERLEYLCARLPLIEERVNNLIDRINGDSSTIGSIEWLEVKAREAEARGFTDLARRITLRIDILTERLDVLEIRLERLAYWERRCAEIDPG